MNIVDQGQYFVAGYFAARSDKRRKPPPDVLEDNRVDWLNGWDAGERSWGERGRGMFRHRRPRIKASSLTSPSPFV